MVTPVPSTSPSGDMNSTLSLTPSPTLSPTSTLELGPSPTPEIDNLDENMILTWTGVAVLIYFSLICGIALCYFLYLKTKMTKAEIEYHHFTSPLAQSDAEMGQIGSRTALSSIYMAMGNDQKQTDDLVNRRNRDRFRAQARSATRAKTRTAYQPSSDQPPLFVGSIEPDLNLKSPRRKRTLPLDEDSSSEIATEHCDPEASSEIFAQLLSAMSTTRSTGQIRKDLEKEALKQKGPQTKKPRDPYRPRKSRPDGMEIPIVTILKPHRSRSQSPRNGNKADLRREAVIRSVT